MLETRSRIAPTPSGYLHYGNIVNFLLTEKLVKSSGGTLALRIDDCDSTRSRPEYIEDIFSTLNWLEISWNEGPRNEDEFLRSFSQSSRADYYFQKLQSLNRKVYACACSRKEISSVYRGTCRNKNFAFTPGQHALRLKIDDPVFFSRFGDPVLWRKDNGPAYHLASVVDDLDLKVNLIVRGEDLKDASDLQTYIASQLSSDGFQNVRFVHHPLLLDQSGIKLSKSRNSFSIKEEREKGQSPEDIRGKASSFLASWGF